MTSIQPTWLILLCLGLFTQLTFAQLPSITGTVFHDTDLSGTPSSGEGIQGVMLNLYQDNGDQVFDPNTDLFVTNAATGSNGQYAFGSLDFSKSYFVKQPTQLAGSLQLNESISNMKKMSDFQTTIDRFNTVQSLTVSPISSIASSGLQDAQVLGGQRDMHLRWISGSADAKLRANPFGLTPVLQFDQSAGVKAVATVTWDGIDTDFSTTAGLGLNGFDLTQGGNNLAFGLTLGIDAAGSGEQLTLRVFSGTNQSSTQIDLSSVLVNLPVTNGTATIFHVLDFSDLQGTADLTHIDAIQLSFGGASPSIDAQLGSIGLLGSQRANFLVSGTQINTPEPASGLLVSVGLLGLLGMRGRRDA